MKRTIKPGIRYQFSGVSKGVSIGLVVLAFTLSQVWAGGPSKKLTVGEIIQKVESAQAGASDAQMDLELEMKDGLSGGQQKMKGSLQIKSPDKIFVHYTHPEEQFLYIGGSTAQMFQPSQKIVYRQRMGKGRNAEPVYVGVGKQLKQYTLNSKVSILKDSGDEVVLLFVPRNKILAGFDKMKVTIRKKDWWPSRMEMETPSMTTKARFSRFSFNKGLKAELFEFSPPKGVDVVDGAIF